MPAHPPAGPASALADHGEEHLQVERHRQHRIRPTPPGQEVQVLIQQRMPKLTTISPDWAFERIRHGKTVDMQAPLCPRGPPKQLPANVHEDHPHIKQIRAFSASD